MRRGIGILCKLVGTVLWPLGELVRALMRADCYDPFAHTVILYHDDPALLTHELGHAQDFAQRTWRFLYILARVLLPPVLFYQEWLASRKGIANLNQRGLYHEVQRANRILLAGFGSYLGSALWGGGAVIGAVLGQLAGAFEMPFGRPVEGIVD